MIISTSKSDVMLRRVFDKGKTSIIAVDRMIEQFSIDPMVTNPPRECYIITNEDISASKTKAKFEQALATKHPNVKVIFINKSSRPIYPQGLPGLDAILQKPKPQDIQQAVSAVISNNLISDSAVPTDENYQQSIPNYQPQQPQSNLVFDESMLNEPVPEPEPEVLDTPEPIPAPMPEHMPVGTSNDKDSILAERIRSAGTVSDISQIMREMTASQLIKDLIDTNSTYAGIEEKLKSIQDVIYTILSDPSIKSLDEKLNKIYAVRHDKSYYSSKGSTLIEQRLEEIIDVICTRCSELVKSRLDEIDSAIRKFSTQQDFDVNSARLSGLNEEKCNIILELNTLLVEINDVFKFTDMLMVDTATTISRNEKTTSGNEMIDTNLEARGLIVASNDVVSALRAILEMSSDKVPSTFKEMQVKTKSLLAVVGKVLDLDQEIIAAQQAQINFLKAHNIEDTVTATSLLKKALRVYVGAEGTGRTIIPYLISKYKSRWNANVLLVDLTGTGKYSNYSVSTIDFDRFSAENNQKEFLVVSGSVENTPETAQRIVTTLLRAADYYRVINVILTPEQRELFATISQDVLSVNFIVDTNVSNIASMAETIRQCTVENVGRRVIINKCDIPVRPIVSKLGLDDTIDIQLCTIPTLPAIAEACVNVVDPYGVSAVDLIMEDVVRHA